MTAGGPFLKELHVLGVRNIRDGRLALRAPVCLVTGDNGSGKTSLLEAVWFLASARSFRSNRVRSMINYQMDRAVVHGRLEAGGVSGSLGVARDRGGAAEMRVNGQPVRATSALAEMLPVQLLNPESIALVAGGPAERRRFLDWGTFHVEHSFLEAWKGYRRALEHRNTLLRYRLPVSPDEFRVWEQRMAWQADVIDAHRRSYLERLDPVFGALLAQLGLEDTVTVEYRPGWADRDAGLSEVLAAERQRDQDTGFTRAGPHRAELRLSVESRSAAESLSRGQQKIVASALLLAQGRILAEATGRHAVYLVDDLPAELDPSFRGRLCVALCELPAQVIITATRPELVAEELATAPDIDMFHVEHGQISAG